MLTAVVDCIPSPTGQGQTHSPRLPFVPYPKTLSPSVPTFFSHLPPGQGLGAPMIHCSKGLLTSIHGSNHSLPLHDSYWVTFQKQEQNGDTILHFLSPQQVFSNLPKTALTHNRAKEPPPKQSRGHTHTYKLSAESAAMIYMGLLECYSKFFNYLSIEFQPLQKNLSPSLPPRIFK